ncbi:MAG: helix-turn-helix domain-containing protein [Candidatus Dormiibacterota bacterium]
MAGFRSPGARSTIGKCKRYVSARSVHSTCMDPAARLGETPESLLLSKAAAARTLNVSVRQLTRFVASGVLTPVRLGPRLIRFTPAELEAFVARHAGSAQPPPWPELVGRRRRR